jgi:serine/threonine protein kinase
MVLARLEHPNLVNVTDFFSEEDNLYLVMRYVEGQSLDQRIQDQGPLPEVQVTSWARQLLTALVYCHNQGVLHRDIKPLNIIITPEGQAVLVDFGLVKLWNPQAPQTQTGLRGMATPGYAPPEQYEGMAGHTDARSDLYSLGATLYHALTGHVPSAAFARITDPTALQELGSLQPPLDTTLEQVILKALALKPAERFQSAQEMESALIPRASASVQSPISARGTKMKALPWIVAIILVAACSISMLALTQGLPFLPSSPAPTSSPTVAVVAAPTVTVEPANTKAPIPTLIAPSTGSPTVLEPETPTPQAFLRGSELHPLTYDTGDEYVPSLSSDGRRLLFMSNRTGNWQIFVIDLETQQWQRVTDTGVYDYHPRFSPDDSRIVFSSNVSGERHIYLMEADGSNWQQISHGNDDSYPMYFPDGQSILFMSSRGGESGIYRVDLDDGSESVIIDTPANESFPFLSPDGRRVVYQSDAAGNQDIYLMSITDNGVPRQLTYHSARDANPVFSADGSSVFFETNRDGDYEIYQVDLNSGALQNLTQSPGNDQIPWADPGGDWLLFQSDRNGSWDIFALPLSD